MKAGISVLYLQFLTLTFNLQPKPSLNNIFLQTSVGSNQHESPKIALITNVVNSGSFPMKLISAQDSSTSPKLLSKSYHCSALEEQVTTLEIGIWWFFLCTVKSHKRIHVIGSSFESTFVFNATHALSFITQEYFLNCETLLQGEQLPGATDI